MKKLLMALLALIMAFSLSYAASGKPKVILLISEQNISGPQQAWWASEIDLSTVENALAQQFIEQGYGIVEPSSVSGVIKQDKAFRLVNLSEPAAIKLGSLSKADYVVLGKAVASSGGDVPQSSMRSCFANVTAKLIRVKDGKVIAYLDAQGSSVHTDPVSGGKEALANAGDELAVKVTDKITGDEEAAK